MDKISVIIYIFCQENIITDGEHHFDSNDELVTFFFKKLFIIKEIKNLIFKI